MLVIAGFYDLCFSAGFWCLQSVAWRMAIRWFCFVMDETRSALQYHMYYSINSCCCIYIRSHTNAIAKQNP